MALGRRNYSLFVVVFLLGGLYYFIAAGETEKYLSLSRERLVNTLQHHKKPFNDVSLTSIETTIPGGEIVYGYSLLDRLYLRQGTFYIVTSQPSTFPPRRHIISRPLDMGPDKDLEPTDQELQIINPAAAKKIIGNEAIVIEGFSLIAYDTEQFMNHFYHWWGEILLGAWRVYSAFTRDSESASFVSRILLPHIFSHEWRDTPGLNAGLTRATFPSTSIENSNHWDDLAILDKTFVFERAIIVSRVAAHTHEFSKSWHKMISSTMAVNVSSTFWEPIRQTAVQNILGYMPRLDGRGIITSPARAVSDMPFVTYIVRQGGRRRLAESDHDDLVKALKELEWTGICQVYVAHMEKMTLAQQVEIMARSTVLIGVHGNGLTHQLWMPPSSRSAVVEILAPESYIHDYEILARNLGHKHYAVWNDTLKSFPPGKWYEGVKYTPDFHSQSIPVHAPTVTNLIRELLKDRKQSIFNF